MKCYWIKYTQKIVNGFGGTAQGPLIKILPKYKDDVGLIEHEKTHVRQWYAVLREAPINLPQPRSKLKIPLNLALLTAKYPVRATLASLSAHFSVLRA